jgi:hypothetical protein
MNPLHLYGLSPKADELQFCIDNGMTAAMLPMYENLSKPRGIEEFTKLYASLDGETFKEIDAEIQLQPQEGDPDIEDWDIIITPEASLSQYKAVKIHYADADRRNCVSLNTTGKFIAIEGTKGHSIEADNLLIQINDRTPSKQQNAQLINPVKDFRFDGGLHSILFTKPFDADIKSIRLINSRRVDWIAKTKKSRDEFRAVGGDDLTLLTYGYDERGADANPELFESLRLSKKVFPDVKTLTCAREVTEMPEIFQYLDYYSPNNAYINIPQVKDISQRTGTQIWMYVGGGGRYPFPNFERVDLPRICSRAFFWGHIRYNLKGWMYFAINFWRKNTWVPRQWPEIWEHWEPGWGMGALIYPGPNGTPVPSARLEAMRDGIEDYNYFAIAEELLKTRQFTDIKQKQGIKEFIEAAKKTLSPGVTGFLQDHSKMSQIRSKLGRYIEMMSKLDSLP